jgi:hypothetical protein
MMDLGALTEVTMTSTLFLDVTPYISVVRPCFRGQYYLHLQGRIVNEIRNGKKKDVNENFEV